MTDDVADAWERILGRLRAAVAGEFEILREIGSGGMAAVYLAREVALNRQVAIKVMSPALLTGAGMVERFKQEARTIAALDHRNIITIYAVRGSDDLHFFVMKFVKGRSLEHIIRTAGPLPIPLVRGLLFMIGDALGHAHRRGVIHRDVKPANILIDADGNAIVTDFGIAKVAQSEAQTHSAVLLGTPAYMSPEQCYARPATAASDQYSLGVVAYEMITGRPPFTGSQFVVMEAHTKVAPPTIRDVRHDCPPELERAVLRMLAKEPSERWPSVHHALAELGAATLLDDHPVRVALAKLGLPVGDEHGGAETVPRPYVSSLAILAPPDWIEAGDDLTLRASARNWAGDTMPGIAIRWRTNAPEIATVDETGTVKALAPGVVSITASVEDKESSVTVQVVPRRVATVAVSAPHEPIHVGDRVQLVARLEDKTHKELKRPIAWMTSHPDIGTISDAGVLRALSPGLALAFAEADGVRGRVEIRIGPASVAMVLPTAAPTGIVVGGRVVLGATVVDSLNNVLEDRTLTWSTNDARTATITADGLVTARAPGQVEFTCTCEGKTATVGLRVEELPVITGDIPTDGLSPQSTAESAEELPSAVPDERVIATTGRTTDAASNPETSSLARNGSRRLESGTRARRRRRDVVLTGALVVVAGLAFAVRSQGKPGVSGTVNGDSAPKKAVAAGSIGKDSNSGSIGAAVLATPDTSAQKPIAVDSAAVKLAALTAVAAVDITSDPVDLLPGGRTTLAAEVRDSADNTLPVPVNWTSSDKKTAVVDSATGVVRGVKPGMAIIYATAGRKSSNIAIHVKPATGGASSGGANTEVLGTPTAPPALPSTPSSAGRREPAAPDVPPGTRPVFSTRQTDAPCQNLGSAVGSEFNNLIGLIRDRKFSELQSVLEPRFATALLDSIRAVPANLTIRVHCRDLVQDPETRVLTFVMAVEVPLRGGSMRTLFDYPKMQAIPVATKSGPRLTRVGFRAE